MVLFLIYNITKNNPRERANSKIVPEGKSPQRVEKFRRGQKGLFSN